MVTTLPAGSSGWRSASSPLWPNSGISAELRLSLKGHAAVRQADTCPTAGAGLAGPRPLPAAHQDTLPKGGLGNLIALPLQKKPRENGNSVFLAENGSPHPDQWALLSSLHRMAHQEVEAVVSAAETQGDVLGVRIPVTDENDDRPWMLPPSGHHKEPPAIGPLPERLDLVLGNQIYVPKADLSPSLRNRLIRLAALLSIQDLYALLTRDDKRNQLIIEDVVAAVQAGRSPVLLTERREHLAWLADQLSAGVENLIVMQGGLGKRQRAQLAAQIASIPADQPRLILATGRYLGEGFDDERLDTLFLALPISWRGTLTQYAGRLHRLNAAKQHVIICDYVDAEIPVLARMFARRRAGYRAIGYEIPAPETEKGALQLPL